MKRILYLLILLGGLAVPQLSHAQVGIGTETPQGALDLAATDKGLLVPRVALVSRDTASPVLNPQGGALAEGTLVYNLATSGTAPMAVSPGFYYWKDNLWHAVGGSGLTLPYQTTTDGDGIIISTYGTDSIAFSGAAISTTGQGTGVRGTTNAVSGSGIEGASTADSNQAYGVYGWASGSGATGVKGFGNNYTGATNGVMGESWSPEGAGGYFTNPNGGAALMTGAGRVQLGSLSGTGSRMVVAGADGTLSTQDINAFSLPYTETTTAAGIDVTTTATETTSALIGTASAASGSASGVSGQTLSDNGTGISGTSFAFTGPSKGVFGAALSADGYGGYFQNNNGVALRTAQGGVVMDVLAGSGTRMVVAGSDGTLSTQPVAGFSLPYTGSTTGAGITVNTLSGSASAITGNANFIFGSAIGVSGNAAAPSGQGVAGFHSNSSGNGSGVSGLTSSTSGTGVYGLAGAGSGENRGVFGGTLSPAGYGGYFSGTSGGHALRTGTGDVTFDNLAGTGNRMVVAGNDGTLTTQAIPATGLTLPFSASDSSATSFEITNNFSSGIAVRSVVTAANSYALQALDTSNTGYGTGLQAGSYASQGSGVVGYAYASSGTNYGIFGTSYSQNGYGGFFNSEAFGGTALGTGSGKVTLGTLAGAGNRMVVAGADGTLTTQAIPSGGGASTLDTAYDGGSSITADAGAVSIQGTDGLIVTGTNGSGAALTLAGSGTRMFFNPRKSAFRAGQALSDNWDNANVGDMSFASGFGTKASGIQSTAMGRLSIASGLGSVALGSQNTAAGDNSAALGRLSWAGGESSVALGYNAYSMGTYAATLGSHLTANSYGEIALGTANTDATALNANSWNAGDRLLSIGNGQGPSARSNALTVLKNGNFGFGVGNETPSATVDVSGTLRLRGNGAQAGRVLTSDANGNATWQDAATGGSSGWTLLSNNIYQSNIPNGTVGIGTNNPSPDTKLSVFGLEGAKPNGIYINAATNADYALRTTFGKVAIGIGGSTTEKLEVNGAVKIGDATPSAGDGTIRYTAANGFEGKHGSNWVTLGGSFTAGNGITFTNSGSTINAVDASATNELQSLSLDGNTLSISNGNSILLPTTSGSAGYAFKVSTGTNLGIPSGTNQMTFPNEDFDTNNVFDTTTNTFTAPVAGIYQFSAAVFLSPSGTGDAVVNLAFRKNNAAFTGSSKTQQVHIAVPLTITAENTVTVSLQAGDTITVNLTAAGVTAMSFNNVGSDGTYFSGFRIQ